MKNGIEFEGFFPCEEAIEEYRKKFKTFREAWDNCERGDWMLWMACRLGVGIRSLTLAKGYCAKTAIHLMEDERSREAVRIAIRFGRYRATKVELDAAAAAAADAYYDAADDAYVAAYAAAAAAYAADADAAADDVAAYAADAAGTYSAADAVGADLGGVYAAAAYDDVEDAGAYDAYAAADAANKKQTSDICRKYLTRSIMNKINNDQIQKSE